jgi:hypothetical protein
VTLVVDGAAVTAVVGAVLATVDCVVDAAPDVAAVVDAAFELEPAQAVSTAATPAVSSVRRPIGAVQIRPWSSTPPALHALIGGALADLLPPSEIER